MGHNDGHCGRLLGLFSFRATLWYPDFLSALSDLRLSLVTIFFDSSETVVRVSSIMVAERASLNPFRYSQILPRLAFSTAS